jgi:hypothetical protein
MISIGRKSIKINKNEKTIKNVDYKKLILLIIEIQTINLDEKEDEEKFLQVLTEINSLENHQYDNTTFIKNIFKILNFHNENLGTLLYQNRKFDIIHGQTNR